MLVAVLKQRLTCRLLRDLEQYALTPAQMGVLVQLRHEEGLMASEIALRALLDQPMVTRVLDRLEQAGLVVRKRDVGDRRRVRIWLTPKGRGLAPRLPPIVDTVERELLRNLNRSQEETLRSLLYQLIVNLERKA